MKFSLLTVTCLALSLLSSARGEMVGYWDFNGSLDRSAGTSGTLSTEFVSFGVGTQGYGSGTDVNLVEGFAEGTSRAFLDLATVAEVTHITAANLNFTGLYSPTVSFAVRNDGVFISGDEFFLEYKTSSVWVRATTFADPGGSFEQISYRFDSGELDNASNASVRLVHSTGVSALDFFEVDNLQITAVPEPTGIAAAVAGLLGVAVWLRRRRFSR